MPGFFNLCKRPVNYVLYSSDFDCHCDLCITVLSSDVIVTVICVIHTIVLSSAVTVPVGL